MRVEASKSWRESFRNLQYDENKKNISEQEKNLGEY